MRSAFRLELRDDLRRRARRREQAEPKLDIHVDAGFLHGRDIGQLRQPRRRGDRQRARLAGRDLRHDGGRLRERIGHLIADDVGDLSRRCS